MRETTAGGILNRPTGLTTGIRRGVCYAIHRYGTFGVDFATSVFERRMIQQTKKDVQAGLHGHEVGRLKIVLKKAGQQVAFQFLGEPEGIDKAKGPLGMY